MIPAVFTEVFGLGFLVTKYLFSQPLRHSLDTLVHGSGISRTAVFCGRRCLFTAKFQTCRHEPGCVLPAGQPAQWNRRKSRGHIVPRESPSAGNDATDSGSDNTAPIRAKTGGGLDLKVALNAVSDIVNNRPLPLREFDQIYMKIGDMVVYTEFLARLFDQQRLVFVGDGDAIGLSLAHLTNEHVLPYGPSSITVLDFDERVVNSINHFAADYELADRIQALPYNVIDALPDDLLQAHDGFHINPPWGQHNDGESVAVFLERGIQLIRLGGRGVVVIADDKALPWTNNVLQRTRQAALEQGMVIEQMIPALHSYHLDDAPELKSCSIIFRKVSHLEVANTQLADERLEDFYGRTQTLRVQYVRRNPRMSSVDVRLRERTNSNCSIKVRSSVYSITSETRSRRAADRQRPT